MLGRDARGKRSTIGNVYIVSTLPLEIECDFPNLLGGSTHPLDKGLKGSRFDCLDLQAHTPLSKAPLRTCWAPGICPKSPNCVHFPVAIRVQRVEMSAKLTYAAATRDRITKGRIKRLEAFDQLRKPQSGRENTRLISLIRGKPERVVESLVEQPKFEHHSTECDEQFRAGLWR
jgi:hypothetical protein